MHTLDSARLRCNDKVIEVHISVEGTEENTAINCSGCIKSKATVSKQRKLPLKRLYYLNKLCSRKIGSLYQRSNTCKEHPIIANKNY